MKEKKKWKYFQLSDYKFVGFTDIAKTVREVAGGLLELGVEKNEVGNIYAATR